MTKNASIKVRPIPRPDLPQALELVERVFLAFEAPEYSAEGIQTFLSFLRDAEAVSALRFYGAWENGVLLGVLATRGGSHIALF
ncbi:MAG: GNAT family N-acetyltransferase, partial [Clostridia bacterium]|nr:GNAT family N-acetyltransferase [Clostridia bacterium]